LVALEKDSAARGRNEPDGGPCEARLAASRFAHEPDDLATVKRKGGACNRSYTTPSSAVIVDDHVVQL
jgi:hypothetical protein